MLLGIQFAATRVATRALMVPSVRFRGWPSPHDLPPVRRNTANAG